MKAFPFLLLIGALVHGCAAAPSYPDNGRLFAIKATSEARKVTEAFGRKWVISTQGRAATDAADGVLRGGGNLIDAAIAASFAISVERPHSTGLGGGGFLLYREAKSGRIYAIDFRERAPSAATEKMYLDPRGEVIPDRSLVGIHSAGVPGLVRGLADLHRRFGSREWSSLVTPSARLAEEGIVVYPTLAEALKDRASVLARFESSKKIFLKGDGSAYQVGERIIQADLGRTLRQIARNPSEFYSGEIARKVGKTTRGWITRRDLRSYRSKWREPVRSDFSVRDRKYEIVSMPPPSSGGTHLIQILNQLENSDLRSDGFLTAPSIHRMATAMQLSFLDRARYMGDPDFAKVPVSTLISKDHAEKMRANFDPKRAIPAEELPSRFRVLPESADTTHFSIMDSEGNAVVSTQTINGWFGSGLVVEGTGILLNNEMDDFSAKPGASNLFGAIGSTANNVQPGKTPLSSMSPTIVLENGLPRMAIGAPGGTRIITCVAQTIVNHLVYGLSLYDSVNALRIHQQWKPDVLRIENPGLDSRTERELASLGWKIERAGAQCAVMAVARDGSKLVGVSEPRDHGKASAE